MNKIKFLYDVVMKMKDKEVINGTFNAEGMRDNIKFFVLNKEFAKNFLTGQTKAKISTEIDYDGKKVKHESTTEFSCQNCSGSLHKSFIEHIHSHHGQSHEMDEEGCRQYHRKYHEEFRRLHRAIKYLRPFILIFNLIILYLLFHLVGTKSIGIFFALMLIIKEIIQLFFFWRLDKRILKPIEKLKQGVEEISRGNYNVRVESNVTNEINLLVDSFNEMAYKLKESEEVKAEYEENRKDLIANISHDLKTPITSIQGYIEAIMDRESIPKESLKKYLQVIYSNTTYINKLIDDLFLFSKLDIRKLDFIFEKVYVKAFVSDLMEEFKFELEERQVKFDYRDEIDCDFLVEVDRKRIHQAIRNIIGNAVKYGPESHLVIEARLFSNISSWSLEIEDNGPGIPQDKLPNIFDRFYRIDNERTKDFYSTGLGLAIAKELIEAHGGEIRVSRTDGDGTCFIIALPAKRKFVE